MKKISLLIFALLFLSGYVRSETKSDTHNFSFRGGVAEPFLKINVKQVGGREVDVDNAKSGSGLGISYLYQMNKYVGAGLDMGANFFNEKKTEKFFTPDFNIMTKATLFSLDPILKVSLLPESQVHPFVKAGVGSIFMKASASYENLKNPHQYNLYDYLISGVSSRVGAGVDVDLSDAWVLGVNFDYHYIYFFNIEESQRASDGQYYRFTAKSGNVSNISLSLTYRFD